MRLPWNHYVVVNHAPGAADDMIEFEKSEDATEYAQRHADARRDADGSWVVTYDASKAEG